MMKEQKISLILLAAGNSRRFGSNKLLYELNGKPLYAYPLEKLKEIAGNLHTKVLVITQYQEILEDVRKIENVQGVFSPESPLGMSYTIGKGVEAAREEKADYLAFFTGDMPYLSKERAKAFLAAFLSSGKKLGCVSCGENFGIPAVFSMEYAEELLSLTGDQGGRKVLMSHQRDCFFFEIPKEEWKDVDTREDCLKKTLETFPVCE